MSFVQYQHDRMKETFVVDPNKLFLATLSQLDPRLTGCGSSIILSFVVVKIACENMLAVCSYTILSLVSAPKISSK